MYACPVAERTPALVARLVDVWEASVRATHHFLTEADIQSLKPQVETGLRMIPDLGVIAGADGEALAFMGVDGTKIEMLFVHPKARGIGLGRRMIERAVREFGADRLDVNEQNAAGVGFYLHLGFEAVGRSAVDGQGRPFPLLHLRLRSGGPESVET